MGVAKGEVPGDEIAGDDQLKRVYQRQWFIHDSMDNHGMHSGYVCS